MYATQHFTDWSIYGCFHGAGPSSSENKSAHSSWPLLAFKTNPDRYLKNGWGHWVSYAPSRKSLYHHCRKISLMPGDSGKQKELNIWASAPSFCQQKPAVFIKFQRSLSTPGSQSCTRVVCSHRIH